MGIRVGWEDGEPVEEVQRCGQPLPAAPAFVPLVLFPDRVEGGVFWQIHPASAPESRASRCLSEAIRMKDNCISRYQAVNFE